MTRDYYFDNLKYFLIVCVVVGHALEPLYYESVLAKSLYDFIYFFHIPLFVFVTGYFSRQLDKLAPLLLLYLSFETLYTLFDYFLFDRPKLSFSFFQPNWLMWYLLAVLLWKLALPYVTRVKYPIVVASVLAVAAGYATRTDLGYTLASLRVITFMPFFLAGYYIDGSRLERLKRPAVRIAAAIVLPLSLAGLYLYGQDFNCQWLWGSFNYRDLGHPEWYAGAYRLAAGGATVLLSVCVLALTPSRRTPLSGLGANTICPYLLHGFVIIAAKYAGIYEHLQSAGSQMLLIAAAVVLATVLSLERVERSLRYLFRPNLSFLVKQKERTAAS